MSHVETITGGGGGHCQGANTRAGLTMSGAAEASAARALGPGVRGRNKVREAAEAIPGRAFLGDLFGEKAAEKR